MAVCYVPARPGYPWRAEVGTGKGFLRLAERFDTSLEAALCSDGWVIVPCLPWMSVSSLHTLYFA